MERFKPSPEVMQGFWDYVARGKTPLEPEPSVKEMKEPKERPKKTHCVRGHPLSGGNVYLHQNRFKSTITRHCRQCRNIHRKNEHNRKVMF